MAVLAQGNDNEAIHDNSVVAPIEVELKLRASPGALDLVRMSAPVQLAARNKGIIRKLEATYYDTADHTLFNAGLSLRVRKAGKQYVQTVKRAAVNGSLSRLEWEAAVAGMAPDLTVMPVADIGSPFDTVDAAQLIPVFITKVRRHLLMIDLPDGQVEMAFDDGFIEVDTNKSTLSEIELELKSGNTAALYQFGLSLMDVSPLCLETQTKSARGYALSLGNPQLPVKAVPSGLARGDTVDEGITKLLLNCQQQVLGNLFEANASFGPESIHQLRVGLRRLRTVLHFLRHELDAASLLALDAQAKRFAQSLGPARNWDVFINSTLSTVERANLQDIEIASLRTATTLLQEQSYRAVQDAVADPQTNRFLLSLGLVIEKKSWRTDVTSNDLKVLTEPVANLAVRILNRLEQKALKRGRAFRDLRSEERHKLRLTLKNLRYASEFFLPIFPGRKMAEKIPQEIVQIAGSARRSQ
ncbi:CHAD domain-containing protein (plasmid) [Phyllobacterium sp. 628]|uniref:CYTH and CHAD domain-containing protein n=1 Tax=Phyllobacterium sp. 628 TaxID=2718938 RepID=UPI00166287BC|nr:CYTH and CHAD domain-containing protein [Phyllobacterium sp. 628]QND55002.1 CHAD domain-containing protein [Phyllobacterium sp. 628]